MDNFFQILFILFIILSFLAPLFKKKPGEQQKKRQQQPVDDDSNSSTSYPSYSTSTTSERDKVNYDILQEIEGMFNKPAETTPVTETSVNEEKEVEHYKTSEWHEPSKSEATIDDEWHRPTTLADYEKEKEFMDEKAKEFEKLLNKKKEVNIVARNIRNSITNPETLKEYIVISEILGKPRGFESY